MNIYVCNVFVLFLVINEMNKYIVLVFVVFFLNYLVLCIWFVFFVKLLNLKYLILKFVDINFDIYMLEFKLILWYEYLLCILMGFNGKMRIYFFVI